VEGGEFRVNDVVMVPVGSQIGALVKVAATRLRVAAASG
jgi:hypothetical protein